MGGGKAPNEGSQPTKGGVPNHRQGARARRTTQLRMGALFVLDPQPSSEERAHPCDEYSKQAPTLMAKLRPTQSAVDIGRIRPANHPSNEQTHSHSSGERSVDTNDGEHRATECESPRGRMGGRRERQSRKTAETPPLGLIPRSRPRGEQLPVVGFSRSLNGVCPTTHQTHHRKAILRQPADLAATFVLRSTCTQVTRRPIVHKPLGQHKHNCPVVRPRIKPCLHRLAALKGNPCNEECSR